MEKQFKDFLKATVKQHTRKNKKTGKMSIVKQHTDKRLKKIKKKKNKIESKEKKKTGKALPKVGERVGYLADAKHRAWGYGTFKRMEGKKMVLKHPTGDKKINIKDLEFNWRKKLGAE